MPHRKFASVKKTMSRKGNQMKNYNYPWIPREEALKLLLERTRFQPRVELVPLDDALGRVTAKDILAINTLPTSAASNLDGIAFKFTDGFSGGVLETAKWREGVDYVFSNTGVGIPDGYDTVVPIEAVRFDNKGRLLLLGRPRPGQYVIPEGSTMRSGDLLVPAHYQLGPAQLGLLAAGGVMEVAVLEKPRVAILPTGNELVPAGCRPPRGKNVEFNGIMIKALVQMMGAEPRLYPITLDKLEDLTEVITDALNWADIVVLNGGSSKGTDDRAIEVLEQIGDMLVYEMAYGPGKHTTLAVAGTKPIVGSVGPTIGAEYAIEWYVLPLINQYYSLPTEKPRLLQVKLLNDINAPMAFDFYMRLIVEPRDGAYVARTTGTLVDQLMANALLHIPKDVKGYHASDTIEVELCGQLEGGKKKVVNQFNNLTPIA
jgi:molybdopterin molybdotransferase